MFYVLRNFSKVHVLNDEDSFWEHCNKKQRFLNTPDGPAADAEERLDLRVATAIKELLEREVGPEEGENAVQMQNWDWNDDRCRGVLIVKSAFCPNLISQLQSLLAGEFEDFHIILSLYANWETDASGHLRIGTNEIAIQKQVIDEYTIAQ